MPPNAALAPEAPAPVPVRPWPLLVSGLALAVLAWTQPHLWADAPDVIRFLLLVASGLALLSAVVFRFRQASWELPHRIETAAMVSVCGLAAIAGYDAAGKEWVSARVLLGALFLLCLGGTVLTLLSGVARRIAISLVLLFHFGGIATAVTLIDPPGESGPWVAKQLWARVYRPYLSFLYLTNAYHFYSPNPGPPSLFWFAIQYDDGSYTWVKLPDRRASPIGMHYQRILALPEHSFAQLTRLPINDAELRQLHRQERAAGKPLTRLPAGTWQDIVRRRYEVSLRQIPYVRGDKPGEGVPIPFIREEDMNWGLQYREPTEYSKRILGSVAKRVLLDAPPPPREGVQVKSVKMYRVTLNLLSPYELANGVDPLEKTKHWGYFLGEFDPEGKLIDAKDPFLYWFLPIVYVPKDYPNDKLSWERRDVLPEKPLTPAAAVPSLQPFAPAPKDGFLLDSIELHAAGRLYKAPKASPKPSPQEKK